MPILAMFYGVGVYMYFYDTQKHRLPQFHVEYAEFSAVVAVTDGDVLQGFLPSNKMKLVQAGLEINRADIMADWSLAVRGLPLQKIRPLE